MKQLGHGAVNKERESASEAEKVLTSERMFDKCSSFLPRIG